MHTFKTQVLLLIAALSLPVLHEKMRGVDKSIVSYYCVVLSFCEFFKPFNRLG